MSQKCRVGYIDEQSDWIDKFQRQLNQYFEIKTYIPGDGESLDQLTSRLFADDLDALVIDYELSEAKVVPYNGDDIVSSIRQTKPLFPLFIITSKDEEQVLRSVDDNDLVRLKDELTDKPQILAKRIENKIDNYHKVISEANQKIGSYNELKETGQALSKEQEDDLFHQYLFLEQVDPTEKVVPDTLLTPASVRAINELVEETRKVLDELKKNDK